MHPRNGIAWERGRPARIPVLLVAAELPWMLQAVTLSAAMALARPKESHGAAAG